MEIQPVAASGPISIISGLARTKPSKPNRAEMAVIRAKLTENTWLASALLSCPSKMEMRTEEPVATISAKETVAVNFENAPNGSGKVGHGIENHYSFTPDGTGIGVGGDFGSPTPSPEKPFQGDNVTPQE